MKVRIMLRYVMLCYRNQRFLAQLQAELIVQPVESCLLAVCLCVHHHHHHHHHADIYNAPITTKQEHRCSTKIQIVVDETY